MISLQQVISFWLYLCSPQQLSDLSSTTVPVPKNVGETHSHSSSSCRPRCPSSLHQVTTPMQWHSKRIKFIYFLARTRIVSRLMMVRTACINGCTITGAGKKLLYSPPAHDILYSPLTTSPSLDFKLTQL